MSLQALCGLSLLLCSLLLLLRELGGRLLPLGLLASGTVFTVFLLERYRALFSFLEGLPGGETVGEAVSLGLRILGIACLSEVSAGMCRDLGEGSLATRLEWCGRAELLLVSLPLLSRLLEAAVLLVSG